ncbi:MAG TPA: site-2 protease family protein [Thermoleophilaceae bacterium]|nr:site-2 protease family protein [Thermoleophilaceae bacterium]
MAGANSSAQRTEGPLHASFTVGRVAGVEIGINWSWLVVVWLILWSLGSVVFPEEVPGLSDGAYAAMAVVATVLFFASLLLHELGHALVARREGMEIAGITLWLFGGVARFSGMFPSARAELRIALAGPLVSLVLGGLFVGLSQLPLPRAVDGVVAWLGWINLILLAFNMLPALPLDGGRVLRALLWQSSGDFTRATRTAGSLGRIFGYGMTGLGVLLVFAGGLGGLWFVVLGLFLAGAAEAETSLATMRAALGGLRVRDAMVPQPERVPADLSVCEFLDGPFAHSRHASYPVDLGGGAFGLLSYRDVARVPLEDWPEVRVRDLAVPAHDGLVVRPGDELGDALVELAGAREGRALVLDDGRLAGLLSMTDVSRLLEVGRLRLAR